MFIADSMVESAKGRQAQIYSKNNVGTSGAFARILGLNNRDTRLHPSPNYVCNTRHYIQIIIPNEKSTGTAYNKLFDVAAVSNTSSVASKS